MTASLFVIGIRVGWMGRDVRADDARPGRAEDVVHAVAKPVVDGLEASLCGQLVRATAAQDWPSHPEIARCEECARLAG
ncbi:hypothetical protein ABC795_03565 [Blastococcus sp. HT6-30]|uniref:hypothetical protein n=1 Tax=Blastococcus sp. HT6-30 TaxID=3144843 RepID=UPI00321B5C77